MEERQFALVIPVEMDLHLNNDKCHLALAEQMKVNLRGFATSGEQKTAEEWAKVFLRILHENTYHACKEDAKEMTEQLPLIVDALMETVQGSEAVKEAINGQTKNQ